MSQQIVKYGLPWTVQQGRSLTDAHAAIELAFIRGFGYIEKKGIQYGLGLRHHILAFQKIAWPWKYWHRWNEDLILPELCKPGRLAIFGPSSTGKSMEPSFFVLTMFYARPKGTTAIVSSTTLDSLDRRIWGYIVEFHRKAKQVLSWLPGHMIESKRMLLADSKDTDGRSFKDGIIGVACKKGNQWQSLAEYIGTKNEVFILDADEAQFLPGGFLDSAGNLESNDISFVFVTGNLNDTTTTLGRAAEPKLGWDSLPDSEKSRSYETRWHEGRAIQLIGKDSPNLDFPEGKEPYRGLIGRRYIEKQTINYGKDTPLYHMFVSGMIPRGTMERRVITRSLAIRSNAMEPVIWGDGEITKLYCLDAAYSSVGGDRTCGVPLAFGQDIRGETVLALLERPKIYIGSPDKLTSHEDFIALQCKDECERIGVPPERLFYDGTGRSSLTSSLARLWSANIIPLEFGGRASERPNFNGMRFMEGPNKGHLKPCKDVFGKFVTELWFAANAAMQAKQLRALTEEIIDEGCKRPWNSIPGGKQDVEPKEDTRERLGRSPDLFDMFVCGLEGARRLGFPLGRLAELAPKTKSNAWLKHRVGEVRSTYREKELAYS
jgi:hypothetical protein